MRAMVVPECGGREVLRLTEIADPTPGEHDLLIEVHGCGLNPVDFKIRRGAFGVGRKFPFVLGYDVSGVVRATGSRAEGFRVGDEVYAMPSLVREGANAEYVCVDARTAAPRPRNLDHVHAAALPLVTLTAWEALYERAKIEKDQTILIHAGGGGVGHIAIQLAKRCGCRVLTTAGRAESMALCRMLGADLVIDYTAESFVQRVMQETDGQGSAVVFDCVGGEVFDQSMACLAVNGRVVTIVGTGSAEALRTLFVKNASLHSEFVGTPTFYGIRPEKQGNILRSAAALVESDELRVHVSRVLDLEELPEAHRMQETGHVTGKIAVRVR